jgi:hypothetical protein
MWSQKVFPLGFIAWWTAKRSSVVFWNSCALGFLRAFVTACSYQRPMAAQVFSAPYFS